MKFMPGIAVLFILPLISDFAFAAAYAGGIIHVGSQCYMMDLSKTPDDAKCTAKLRAAETKVTEGDIINCNIQTGLLVQTNCP